MTPRAKSKLDEEYFRGCLKSMVIIAIPVIGLVAIGLYFGIIR